MFCCFPSGIPKNASHRLSELTRVIQILAIVQLVLAIFMFFVSVWEGVMMLVGTTILLCTFCGRNWISTVFYIFIVVFNAFSCILRVGNYLTANDHLEGMHGSLQFFSLITIPFYVISVYYVFEMYRELKGLYIDMLEGRILNEND
jgi:hypothetical protein